MDDVQGRTNVTEEMDVVSDRAKVEQCTTAWTQEVERLRRQSRGAIVEEARSDSTEKQQFFNTDAAILKNYTSYQKIVRSRCSLTMTWILRALSQF